MGDRIEKLLPAIDVFDRLTAFFEEKRTNLYPIEMLPDDIWSWTDETDGIFPPGREEYRSRIMQDRYRRAIDLGDGADKETILEILSGRGEPPLTDSLDPAVALYAAFPLALPRPIRLDAPWQALKHTVCGTGCGVMHFVGVRLRMRPEAEKVFETVAHKYEGSEIGFCYPSLDQLLGYRESIRPGGVDCNNAYRHLCEAAYPVDWEPEVFRALAEPTADAEMLKAADDSFSNWGCLLVLAPNSD